METRYTVTGMTCGHCVAHVTEEVKALPQVDDVVVSLPDSMVITSAEKLDLATVTEAVKEAGDYVVAEA